MTAISPGGLLSPEKQQKFRFWGNAGLFELLWPAAIVGAYYGSNAWAVAVLIAMFIWSKAFGGSLAQDLRMAFVGLLVAFTFEPIWMGADLLLYALQPPYIYPPVWIVCLWVGFAMSFNHCLYWLRGRYGLAAVLGVVGSVLSITAAERIGALTMPSGWWPAAVSYALPWAFITPAFAWFTDVLKRRAQGDSGMSQDKSRASVAVDPDKPAPPPQ
ncbi:MAG: hypothetical protein CME36_11875 [unclassified Hahellaceae]|nr:hypothetical protein [Hahellaceae bacterium]